MRSLVHSHTLLSSFLLFNVFSFPSTDLPPSSSGRTLAWTRASSGITFSMKKEEEKTCTESLRQLWAYRNHETRPSLPTQADLLLYLFCPAPLWPAPQHRSGVSPCAIHVSALHLLFSPECMIPGASIHGEGRGRLEHRSKRGHVETKALFTVMKPIMFGMVL